MKDSEGLCFVVMKGSNLVEDAGLFRAWSRHEDAQNDADEHTEFSPCDEGYVVRKAKIVVE